MKYVTSYHIVNLTVSLIHQAKWNNNELDSLSINRSMIISTGINEYHNVDIWCGINKSKYLHEISFLNVINW